MDAKETDEHQEVHEDEIKFEPRECSDEAQRPNLLPDPGDPSPDEIEAHYQSNHLPFRAWCKCCVLAKAKDKPHKKSGQGKTEEGVPIVGIDFCHPGEDEDGEDKMDILVVKDLSLIHI
eukprot:2558546-Karenia_brevis.AAC.1